MAARDFCAPVNPWLEWSHSQSESRTRTSAQWVIDKDRKPFLDFFLSHDEVAVDVSNETTAEKFRRLADEWSRSIGNISSMTAVVRHPKYQEIIDLGWDAVPLMLIDLQTNHRFWFPALHEITGIRPFDERDAGNSKIMIQAWVQWGKRKQLI